MAQSELKERINLLPSKKGLSSECSLSRIMLVAIVLLVLGNGVRADAQNVTNVLVLVNSRSAGYVDFEHYIRPYLENFGIPFTVLDIANNELSTAINAYALILIGHRQLDPDHLYLSLNEENFISSAVSAGTGLVDFDNDLSAAGGAPRYQFIQNIFGFTYAGLRTDQGVTITAPQNQNEYRINCWENNHQQPLLETTTDPSALGTTDGAWTEFLYSDGRPFPGVFAGVDEENYGLPVMHFFATNIPNGEYTIYTNLYDNAPMRYFFGFTADNPKARSVDVAGGASGTQFREHNLGTVSITNGDFNIYVRDADILPGGSTYPFFGWAWIRLAPAHAAQEHYIIVQHEVGERITTGNMSIAGLILQDQTATLATTDSTYPFLVAVNYGQGRGVQWCSYDWMSYSVKGPLYGLDDLVWRSIVWAARKPFVMQGLPPFVTMRVDDEYGPFDWIHIANEFGLRPWAGLFYLMVAETDASDLSALVNAGQATASVHAKGTDFFYFNHDSGDFSDAQIASNFLEATAWHQNHNIPISKFVLSHFYEFGTNVFDNLRQWGVEFVGTMMEPGNGYGAPWIQGKPYRLYEAGASNAARPVYYAHFLDIPLHPEMNGRFFNRVTEIRDDAGYEWYPSNSDVAGSIGRGTRQTKRALDSLDLATLFTHSNYLHSISSENFRTILRGITDNLRSYNPIYVTMDYACQYVRAMYTSDISNGSYDPGTKNLTVTLTGKTDLPTVFYMFTEQAGDIQQTQLNVPIFSGSTTVFQTLIGTLDHIVVTPSSVTLAVGQQQQFTAQGYDRDGVQIPSLQFTWAVVNGGGTIDANGLFTAGTVQGVFQNTVVASSGGVSGSASVNAGGNPPAAPTNLTATAGNGQVALTWQASSGATSYTVRRSLTSGGPYTAVASGVTATSYIDTTVQNGTRYYYVVAAVYAGGESPNSNEASALPQVAPATLDHFNFDSITGTIVAGMAFGVRITAYDQFGNVFGSYTGQAALSDTTGTISPTTTGNFVSGVWSGNVTIAQVANGVTITARSGAATGVSNTFNVVAPLQEITINCWEDNHQQPVLVTTTDPAALNPTDGAWTEFLYSGGRPYPGVFAGVDEENYGLPVMRFYATGIPNGRYEVIANLYTNNPGRDMRYYYGYTAGTPKAYSVDTVGGAGGSTQFQEYSLGTVEISDGNFNIYVRDADLLAGSYPYFGWAWIRLVPRTSGALKSIVVTPATAKVAAGASQQFAATGYDANGNPIPNLTFTWSRTSGGTVDQNGLFTAGFTPGIYNNNVSAANTGISGYASVEVYESVLDHFSFDSITGTIVAGMAFGVRITAYDQFGNVFGSYTGQAALSDTTGTISPTMTGNFVSGVWSGNVTIAQVANGVTITARSGAATGVSNAFNVVAPPQEITINCWEDNHQQPVLVTTTDPAALNPTDGAWTEFLYSGGRPYPGVFAGVDEENYGLPVMRFYTTGIPNGRYEVIANLYTNDPGRNMRYYYGYTPGNPKAYSVDTVGGVGGSTQFQEYSLGTVEISNGNFNIYVRDADLLGGSYPYLGWAWIRLVRVIS